MRSSYQQMDNKAADHNMLDLQSEATPDLIRTGSLSMQERGAVSPTLDSDPIITDELNPTPLNKVIRVVKEFVLFPTRTRVIASIITLLWLLYCFSMITFGLTNDHYCPAQPKLSGSIALHGFFWVFTCGYVIFRLIWAEVSPGGQPGCRFKVGNPDVWLEWRKEMTFALDCLVFVLLVSSYIYNLSALWTLLSRDPHLLTTSRRDWLKAEYCERVYRSDNCCRRFLVDYAVFQQIVSYLGMAILILSYMYVMGFVDFLRSRVCMKRFAASKAEVTPLI